MKQLTGNEVEIVRKETCNLPTQNEETFWLEEAYKTDFQSKSRFNAPNTSYLMKIDIWIFNAALKPLQARAQYDLLTFLHVSKWCTSQTSKPNNFFFNLFRTFFTSSVNCQTGLGRTHQTKMQDRGAQSVPLLKPRVSQVTQDAKYSS